MEVPARSLACYTKLMRLEQDSCNAQYQITGYEPGLIHVNHIGYECNLIITQNTLIREWPITHIDAFRQEDLNKLSALNTEIIIIGTGTRFQRPGDALLKLAESMPIGIEYMDTGAACRTFMALLMEGRNVAAGLLIK
jgi:uncharacterized protein